VERYDAAMSFDEAVAASYDAAPRGDEEAASAFLARLAGDGRALELAIGTGRIALPLADRGVPVDGIDISEAMIARLREKPGGAELGVTIGNFADVDVPDAYRLIYVVFNTLFNLRDQAEQVRCFENVAAHLTDDGLFAIEAFTPGYLHRLRDDQYVDAEEVRVDKVWLDVARHDPVAQRLDKNHVSLSPAGIRLNPVVLRYAWPSELDLMARIAGLVLRERWGGWSGEPFTGSSRMHVSVYGR
jgi:SAM-dependent methyltransferase